MLTFVSGNTGKDKLIETLYSSVTVSWIIFMSVSNLDVEFMVFSRKYIFLGFG